MVGEHVRPWGEGGTCQVNTEQELDYSGLFCKDLREGKLP